MIVYLISKHSGSYSDYSCEALKIFAYKEDADAFVKEQKDFLEKIIEVKKVVKKYKDEFWSGNFRKEVKHISFNQLTDKKKFAKLEAYNKEARDYNDDIENKFQESKSLLVSKLLEKNNLPLDTNYDDYDTNTDFTVEEFNVDFGVLG